MQTTAPFHILWFSQGRSGIERVSVPAFLHAFLIMHSPEPLEEDTFIANMYRGFSVTIEVRHFVVCLGNLENAKNGMS